VEVARAIYRSGTLSLQLEATTAVVYTDRGAHPGFSHA
jgi:hypothetical protein